MTEQRRVIARVLWGAANHPDVGALDRRASAIDPKIAIATVDHAARLFEQAGILARHDLGDGRGRYPVAMVDHHDHLIDMHGGRVIEFQNDEIESPRRRVASEPGVRLIADRLEQYGMRSTKAKYSDGPSDSE